MHKHLFYSFKGKKTLYVLLLLTIVIATIVSVYCVNNILLDIKIPKTDDLVFDTSEDYDLVALNNLVKTSDIEYVKEEFHIDLNIRSRKVTVRALRENTNKWYGKNVENNAVIVSKSSYLLIEYPDLKENDIINIAGKEFKVISISEILKLNEYDFILPFNTENNLLNVKYYEFNDCTSKITIGNNQPLTTILSDKLTDAGLKMENLKIEKFYNPSYYQWDMIMLSIAIIVVCVICISIAYGYILRNDRNLNEIYNTVGANNNCLKFILLVEMLLVFSLGYGVGCAISMPLLHRMITANILVNGLDLFILWISFAVMFTALLLTTKRNELRIKFTKKVKKKEIL